jgi:phenylpropionate dioxygenase-like ring-hydroxylating dioxygenase large terminal subunit
MPVPCVLDAGECGAPGWVPVGHLLSNIDPALRRCWHPIARPAEVTEQPRRFMLLGEPWVLYRASGRIVAFPDRCPHRRTPLSIGHCEAGVLQCAYHGWRFDSAGACTEIPALGREASLPSAAQLSPPAGLVEAHGMVFLAPEPPLTPLGSIPEADDPTFETGELPTLVARASAGLLADNFLDVAHFPFVHAGTFGADEAAEVPPFVVARDDLSGEPARMADAISFEVAVLREDLRIQEALDDLVLPLGRTAEVHTRADRTTLELRRVLSDLVSTAAG